MKRIGIAIGFLCLFSAMPTRADIAIIVTPDTVLPVPGTKVKVVVDIRDYPYRGGGAAPSFDEPGFQPRTAGTLKYVRNTDVDVSEKWGYFHLHPKGNPFNDAKLSGSVEYEFTLGPNVQPGTVQFAMTGRQGIILLGQRERGATQSNHSGKLVITQVAGAGPPVAPPSNPGSSNAGGSNSDGANTGGLGGSNPGRTKPIASNPVVWVTGALLVAGLAGAAAIALVLTRVGRKQPAGVAAKQVTPGRTPATPPQVNVRNLPQVAPFPLSLLPSEMIMGSPVAPPKAPPRNPDLGDAKAILEATPAEVNGDGGSTIDLNVKLAPGAAPGAKITKVVFHCDTGGYEINGGGNSIETPVGLIPSAGQCTAPWEWESREVTFSADVWISISGKPPKHCQPRPTAKVRIQGAEPQFTVQSSMVMVDGTGRDGTILHPTLELFGKPAESEEIRVSAATSKIGGHEFREVKKIHDAETGLEQVKWIAPFVVKPRDDDSVMVNIDVTGAWVSGVLHRRAPRSHPAFTAEVPLRIYGCVLQHQPSPAVFVPLPETPLQVEASLRRCQDRPMMSPFTSGAVRAPGAVIECTVADKCQGRKRKVNGCSVPPQVNEQERRNVGPLEITDIGKIWTRRELDQDQILRSATIQRGVDYEGFDILLGKYQPLSGYDPIHGNGIEYRIVIRDGLGNEIKGEGACMVSLKRLTVETGGLDSEVLESAAARFEAKVEGVNDEGILVHRPYWQQPMRLRWEFAVVDKSGTPLATAGWVETLVAKGSEASRYPLLVGRFQRNKPLTELSTNGQPIVATEEDYMLSLALRRRWHRVAVDEGRDAEALEWFRTFASDASLTGNVTASLLPPSQPAKPWIRSPWTDRELWLGVRLELRTNDSEDLLIGCSDATESLPTLSELVWGRHTFRYLLAKLRLHLQDSQGRSYARRPFQLIMADTHGVSERERRVQKVLSIVESDADPVRDLDLVRNQMDPETYRISVSESKKTHAVQQITSDDGRLEELVPPGAVEGMLGFLPNPEDTLQQPWCEFDVDLGGLPPVADDEGVLARLENIGLCPDPIEPARAIKRFQELSRVAPTGKADDSLRKRLDEVHQTGIIEANRLELGSS